MKNISSLVKILAIFLVASLVVGCGGMPQKTSSISVRKGEVLSAKQYYNIGSKQLAKNDFEGAAATLDDMESQYPFSAMANQLRLELANAYYEGGRMDEAVATAERFTKMFPGHQNAHYAFYIKGLADFERGVASLALSNSNPTPLHAKRSLASFREMMERFPNSIYAPNANSYISYLEGSLSQHELRVMDGMYDSGDKEGGDAQAQYIVETYPNSGAAARVSGDVHPPK
jgi:outer membrane protein assembly factor BamD